MYSKNFEFGSFLFEKLSENFKSDLEINENLMLFIKKFYDFIEYNTNNFDNEKKINSSMLHFFQEYEKNIDIIIERKQNSLNINKQIKNLIKEKILSITGNNLITDKKELLDQTHDKNNENQYLGNNFEFSEFQVGILNEVQTIKPESQKIQNFNINLLDILKGEEETRYMKMNLMSDLEEFQNSRKKIDFSDEI